MEDRLKFRAITKEPYETKDNEDKEIMLILNNVDVLSNGEIGLDRDTLSEVISKTCISLSEWEKDSLWENIEGNSRGVDDYITIDPYCICQCTGLTDNQKSELVYEFDLLQDCDLEIWQVFWDSEYLQWACKNIKTNKVIQLISMRIFKIIGNVDTTPELSEVQV